MGQRLNIEIMSNDSVLANAYYHWSAYTRSALYLTKEIVAAFDSVNEETDLKKAIRLLELTGAGVNSSERMRIDNDVTGKFAGIEFKDCINRNEGLLAVTKEGIDETRYWEEGRVTIHLDTHTINFDVLWYIDAEIYEEEYEESAEDIPLVDDFDFTHISFKDLYKLVGLIDTHTDGVRFADGAIVRWIE